MRRNFLPEGNKYIEKKLNLVCVRPRANDLAAPRQSVWGCALISREDVSPAGESELPWQPVNNPAAYTCAPTGERAPMKPSCLSSIRHVGLKEGNSGNKPVITFFFSVS